MNDYEALIERARDHYASTDELHRDLAAAVEALVEANMNLRVNLKRTVDIAQEANDDCRNLLAESDALRVARRAERRGLVHRINDYRDDLKGVAAENEKLEARLVAAEAVIHKVRTDAADWLKAPRGEMAPCTGVGRYFTALVSAPSSTVLADHDKEVAAQAWDEAKERFRDPGGCVCFDREHRGLFPALHWLNPYRSGSEGEPS